MNHYFFTLFWILVLFYLLLKEKMSHCCAVCARIGVLDVDIYECSTCSFFLCGRCLPVAKRDVLSEVDKKKKNRLTSIQVRKMEYDAEWNISKIDECLAGSHVHTEENRSAFITCVLKLLREMRDRNEMNRQAAHALADAITSGLWQGTIPEADRSVPTTQTDSESSKTD